MKGIKKNAPKLIHYGYNLNKKWRLEWFEVTHDGNDASKSRKVFYGKINTFKTVEERLTCAAELIERISNDVEKMSWIDTVIERNALFWRPKTVSAYLSVSNSFKNFMGAQIAKATENDVERFFIACRIAGKSAGTICKYRAALSSLYQKGVEMGVQKSNPVKKIAGIRKDPKSLTPFTRDQIEEFYKQPVPPALDMGIKLLFYCFIRPGEIRQLKVKDVYLKHGFIEIL